MPSDRERELRWRADVLGLKGKRRQAYVQGTLAKIRRAEREHRARYLDLKGRGYRRRARTGGLLARIRRIW